MRRFLPAVLVTGLTSDDARVDLVEREKVNSLDVQAGVGEASSDPVKQSLGLVGTAENAVSNHSVQPSEVLDRGVRLARSSPNLGEQVIVVPAGAARTFSCAPMRGMTSRLAVTTRADTVASISAT
jgi:hypothetical protein